MAGRSRESRWFVVTGGTVFTPMGNKYQKVCVFTAAESALDDRIRMGLIRVYGSDPFAEAGGENGSSTEQVPWWALGAPLKNLDDSCALSCLERHLRRRRNLVSTTSLTVPNENNNSSGLLGSNDSLLLVYETNPVLKFENQQDPLSKESFITYLEAWSEIVYVGYEVNTESIDLSSRSIAKQRPSVAAAAPRNEVSNSQPTPMPGVNGVARGARPSTRHPFKEQQAAQTVKKENPGQAAEVISLPSTEVIEAHEYYEEEINGPLARSENTGGGGGRDRDADGIAFESSYPRRSARIFILDSIPRKKQPAPQMLEIKKKKIKGPRHPPPPPAAGVKSTIRNDHTAGPSKPALEARQSKFFRTRPIPKKPVTVICGDAEGLWNPKNPLVITVTKIGAGDGCPEAIAAAAEFNENKKRSLVVPGHQFEKIGGRAHLKNWKQSVRVVPDPNCPDKTIRISLFALEIGFPFEKRLRGPTGPPFNGTGCDGVMLRTLKEVEECRMSLIKETLQKAGYSTHMAEKRLNSKRTFRGGHRPGHPGMFDWRLLLPGGIWVRSREGISRHPKTADMDENDVIFSEDEEGKGNPTRVKCRRTKHCICVQGHAGRCFAYHNFIKRLGINEEKKPSTANKRKKGRKDAADIDSQNEEDVYYSWEGVVDRQRGDRQERWLKRQGVWVTNSGGSGGGGGGEVRNNEEPDSGEDSSLWGESSEGYGGPLGFTSTEEEEYWIEGQEEPMLEDCDRP